MMKIAVLGGGSWGTALAGLLAGKGYETILLVRREEQAAEINEIHENSRYLPKVLLPQNLHASTSPEHAFFNADLCLLACPCQSMGETLRALASYVPLTCIPVCASKGIEAARLMRMSEVVASAWPKQAKRYAILSGPSFALELAANKPTAYALGCEDADLSRILRELFATDYFRVYSSKDVAGVELGGALKNVIAIAAGIADGLGFGSNSRAALITRGLAEICRLGKAMGARHKTFMGLSGMGDLVLTCTTDLSRNRQVGLRLGKGEKLAAVLGDMHNVAEGVQTTEAACILGKKLGVELPIANAMHRVMFEGVDPKSAVKELMTRALRDE